MKLSTFVVGTIAAQGASAHYWFDTNIVNGVAQPAYKYVRESTRQTKYNPTKFSSNPAADIRDGATIDGPDSRCNQGAFSSASRTSVLTVNAGDEIRLRLAAGSDFQHPGPGLVYLSRAPNDNVKAYDGSGNWFKIYQEGVCNQGADFTNSAWCGHNKNWLAAKIPKDTPNGEYLARFEHIGVHRSHVNQPEHYLSCLQIKVVNGGNGNPSPTVKFPGAYKASDGYANFSVYNGYKNFPFPGPAVWSGGGSGGGSNPQPEPTTNPGTGCAALYGQCGGSGFTGAKCCASGTCKASNEWYSQCL
ncbi:glycosyl hydrolase family 61-domain-containing protein [Chaetomidium leptoderma]|uniref:lytic cellulose monooxygenase (C4-dehydrogenating) n=1 Tax=Chaetomidium leptoderma TaxID=669021 RepID=A0AAN6VE35_9PEZI|nr:glycosyl hydrolase family 61-domain-containing protein [Chaetomidium leptoderma]